MSFLCTVLDGVLALNGVAFIVGRLKLGIFTPIPALPVEAAGLLFANAALEALFPKGLLCAFSSLSPVAITVILA